MDIFDVKASLRDALAKTDELVLPPELAEAWDPIECLGRSEYSETLLLCGKKDSRRAVLKLVKGKPADADVVDKLRSLSHPGFPKILTVCRYGDRLCILREYIEGRDLTEQNRRFTAEETVRIALQLCDILSCLHRLTPPMIHRDVKPENILLRPDGTVVLIDFGIARFYSETGEKDTRVMGTENFAPPEQYGFRQTDCRSDLYALGMVMGWMLTGSVRNDDFAAIPDQKLRKVITRCTAFSPDERYNSAEEVKKALLQRPGKTRILIAAVLCCIVLICGGLLLWKNQTKPVVFAEPMIEQAVRQVLGVSSEMPLTAEQLITVEGIYIFGDAVCPDQDGFYAAAGNWYASGTKAHGPVLSLEDVKQLPNLRYVMIAANHITDISPLSSLPNLEKVEFKHNSISDITPLKGLLQLGYVGLNDNPMADVSVLSSLPNLCYLDLCDASNYDPAGLEGLGDMEQLNLSNRTDSWRYLGNKQIHDLRLGWTGIDSLAFISGISGLEHLEIEHTQITSLMGIEQHTELKYLRMSGCVVEDLSPLLNLSCLQEVVVSSDMKPKIDALPNVPFTVQYE